MRCQLKALSRNVAQSASLAGDGPEPMHNMHPIFIQGSAFANQLFELPLAFIQANELHQNVAENREASASIFPATAT
jgi:hypothetical protein